VIFYADLTAQYVTL